MSILTEVREHGVSGVSLLTEIKKQGVLGVSILTEIRKQVGCQGMTIYLKEAYS